MRILFFSVFIIFSSVVFSQEGERDPSRISFGLKVGPGLSKFNVKQPESLQEKWRAEWMVSFQGGAFINIPLAAEGKFNVQPELLYSRQGARINHTVGNISGNYTVRAFKQIINYINVPVMLQFRVPSGFYFETGPQMSLLLSSKQNGPDSQEYDQTEQRNKQDLSLTLGAGHESKKGFALGFRYAHGTKNVVKEQYAIGDREYRNATLFLNFRYFIF